MIRAEKNEEEEADGSVLAYASQCEESQKHDENTDVVVGLFELHCICAHSPEVAGGASSKELARQEEREGVFGGERPSRGEIPFCFVLCSIGGGLF